MKYTKDYELNGLSHYTVLSNNTKYKVDCLDNEYICECALMYNRDISLECKHIKLIKQNENSKINNEFK